MLPLSLMQEGFVGKIVKVNGLKETKVFLEKLGFTNGSNVQLIQVSNGNIIVGVKETRVAINKDMANKIFVEGVDNENIK
ncbi:MAG: ferrous iron transport protein A [Erysipelotrichaceae bacterium]|nr:ferrous iron transport protein A [Erysipelotrichaceae bacterium]